MSIWKIENKGMLYQRILITTPSILEMALLEENKDIYYQNRFTLPKKNGIRTIYCIDKTNNLYRLQTNLAKNFLNNIMLSDAAYGFVKGCSYLDFLNEHTSFYGNKYFLRLDIKSFFDTICEGRIREVLSYYVSEECQSKSEILDIIIDIILYNETIIQGAPSSPAISNIIFRPIDIRIQKYCNKCGVDYSRYADDLLFSSYNETILHSRFISGIVRILSDHGFTLNHKKTIKAKKEISLGGYVISSDIRLSRKKLKPLKSILFYLSHNPLTEPAFLKNLNKELKRQNIPLKFNSKYQLVNYLAGNRSFLISIKRYSGNETYQGKMNNVITSIQKEIDKLENNN